MKARQWRSCADWPRRTSASCWSSNRTSTACRRSWTDLGLELHDFDEALERANLVLLLVDHMSFLQVDRDVLKDKFVIDTRGVW